MIKTYLAQLEEIATASGVGLDAACQEAGVAQTTLWRWRKGIGTPREDTTLTVAGCIERLAKRRAEQGAHPAPLVASAQTEGGAI